ncbi:hypothetical protein PYCCODRAFT_1430953, partial [Trametes coccinea BRFM310]
MHLKVLHHDKSIFNILMYPAWVPHSEGPYCDSFLPLVDDALQEKLLSSKKRDAHCLIIIDLDSPVHLRLDDAKAGMVSDELQYRTGTPAYIARCVSNGALWSTESNCKWWQHKMPELSGRAKDLHVKMYGEAQYDQYREGPGTIHGVCPRPRPMMDSWSGRQASPSTIGGSTTRNRCFGRWTQHYFDPSPRPRPRRPRARRKASIRRSRHCSTSTRFPTRSERSYKHTIQISILI